MDAFANILNSMNDIIGNFQTFSTENLNQVLVLISILTLYLLCKTKQKRNTFLWHYTVMAFILILNPLSYSILRYYGMPSVPYYYVFYTIPSVVILAYTTTEILDGVDRKKIWTTSVVVIGIFLASTNLNLNLDGVSLKFNRAKVDKEIYAIQAMIEPLSNLRVIAPEKVIAQMSTVDDKLTFLYGSDMLNGEVVNTADEKEKLLFQIAQQVQNKPEDINVEMHFARTNGANCMIIDKKYDCRDFIIQNAGVAVGETEHYAIYLI